MSDAVPVLPEVETATDPTDDTDAEVQPDAEPETDDLPDVDDPRTDAEELASLREFADGSFAHYDAVRKAERAVEDAKLCLKSRKATFDTAVAEWGSYTEQNRHPLFGDPLEKDGTATTDDQDDDTWRDVTLDMIGLTLGTCKILEDNSTPITTLGDAVDWTESHPRSPAPFEEVPGIGQSKAIEIAKAMEDYWEENPRETPATEAEPIACSNCGGTTFDEDGDCVGCREPQAGPPDVSEEI